MAREKAFPHRKRPLTPNLRMHEPTIRETALDAWRAGISAIPMLPDGRKRPGVRWRVYQQRLPTPREIACWFGGEWSKRIGQGGFEALHERLTRGYLEATPNGLHLLYRCCALERNQKLASVPVDGPQHFRTLIETRGEGSLVIVAPSGTGVHPSGKPYMLLAGGISTIAAEERQILFSVARSFDQTPSRYALNCAQQPAKMPLAWEQRPGDRYNRRASWAEVLEPHGWSVLYTRDGESYW